MVPATVLAETCYLIDKTRGPTAEAAFLAGYAMDRSMRMRVEHYLAGRASSPYLG